MAYRLDYLFKVTSPALGVNLFDEFDYELDKAFSHIVGCPTADEVLYRRVAQVREIPTYLGGFGIPRVAGLEGARHRLVTYKRTESFLTEYLPHLLGVYQSRFDPISTR